MTPFCDRSSMQTIKFEEEKKNQATRVNDTYLFYRVCEKTIVVELFLNPEIVGLWSEQTYLS